MRLLLAVVEWKREEDHGRVRDCVLHRAPRLFPPGPRGRRYRAPDAPGETRVSWAAGGGVTLFFRRLGIKLQAKFNPVVTSDESSELCDPFGFCAGSLNHFELLSGVVFRF